MNSLPPDSAAEFRSFVRAIRFAFAALVLGASYFNINCAQGIPKFAQVWNDMLGGTVMPTSMQFIFEFQTALLGVSIAIPWIALGLIFWGRPTVAIFGLGTLLLLALVQIVFTTSAWMQTFTIMTAKIAGAGAP